ECSPTGAARAPRPASWRTRTTGESNAVHLDDRTAALATGRLGERDVGRERQRAAFDVDARAVVVRAVAVVEGDDCHRLRRMTRWAVRREEKVATEQVAVH